MQRNRQISEFLDISFGLLSDFVGKVGFRSFCKVESKLEKEDFALWHSDFLNCIIHLIGEQKRIIVRRSDVFARKTQQPPRNIQRILARNEHSLNPIASRMGIGITERLMHSRDDSIVLLTITIVIDLLGSCLNQGFFAEFAFPNEE